MELSDILLSLIHKNGFKVNQSKTRLHNNKGNQTVTGITVNKKININRRYIKNIRAILHKFDVTSNLETEVEKFGYHYGKEFNSVISVFRVLKGRIIHIAHIRGYNDPVYQALSKHFNQIIYRRNIKTSSIVDDNSTRWIEDNVFVIDQNEDVQFLMNEHTFEETIYSQGTAFYLNGVGLVTNYHVISTLVTDVIEKNINFVKNIILSTHLKLVLLQKEHEFSIMIRMQI